SLRDPSLLRHQPPPKGVRVQSGFRHPPCAKFDPVWWGWHHWPRLLHGETRLTINPELQAMQNLEQIRARNVLTFAEEIGNLRNVNGGEVIKKIPPLILNYGLLATAAYSFTEREGWQKVFDALAKHLA